LVRKNWRISAIPRSGFALIAWDGHQHFTRYGNNVRNDHDGKNNARGEKTYAIDRALKKRQETQGVLERGLNVLAHQRNDDKNAEQTIDDAGNGGQQIDEELQRIGNPCRGKFRKKDCSTDAEGDGNHECNAGSYERPIDKRQRAELPRDRVPDLGPPEAQSELLDGRHRLDRQDQADAADERNQHEPERAGPDSKRDVATRL
jgi:hypothetical protein